MLTKRPELDAALPYTAYLEKRNGYILDWVSVMVHLVFSLLD
jgi:hypothetical protein